MRPDARPSRRPGPTVLVGLIALVVPALASADARAQDGSSMELPSTPEAAVVALFDAMRAADSATARRLFDSGATLARPVEGDAGVALQRADLGQFLEAIGSAEPGSLDEKIGEIRVRRDGRLATAWMDYAFYLDGDLHHCGVNAFQLYRAEAGWKIFGIADTSRTEGCAEEWSAD